LADRVALVTAFLPFALAFLATSLVASANYVINEYLDAEFDRFHPTKKHRPVVAESLKPGWVWAEYAAFSVAGLALAAVAGKTSFWAVAFLWVMGLVYNVRPIRSKDIAYVDVLSESVNNAIRFLIGWFVLSPTLFPPASIVFGYWMGGAFLMAAKRFAEFRMIGDPAQAALYRRSFRYYTEERLLISAFYYALLSLFFCGIFLIKYRIELLVAIPFLCGLFCIYLNLCYKPDSSAQKPEKLFREKGLMLYVTFFVTLLAVLMVVPLPFLDGLHMTHLIGIAK
jgi:4-hydroxybenzoate polyprenyltransferase